MKSEVMWAVWSPDIGIYPCSLADTRRLAIAKFVTGDAHMDEPTISREDKAYWRWGRNNRSFRAVKVRLTVIGKTMKGV